jgi:hypothetical protein
MGSLTQLSGPYIIDLSNMQSTLVQTPQDMHVYGMSRDGFLYLGLSAQQMFVLRDETDGTLYYVSTDGVLSPTGLASDSFSISPDRQYILLIGSESLQVYGSDGTHVREVALPNVSRGMVLSDVIWRPDSSGLFIRYEKGQSSQPDLESLYAVDVLSGQPVQVEDRLSGDWMNDPFWIYP